MKVLVEGRLTADQGTGGPRIWSGNDGSPRASFEVTAATVRFLSSRGEYDASPGSAPMDAGDMLPPEDDIPF
jgi:single-strand DNA-binding protein